MKEKIANYLSRTKGISLEKAKEEVKNMSSDEYQKYWDIIGCIEARERGIDHSSIVRAQFGG